MNPKALGDLVMAHKGQRIVLMAGGPSLASDLEKIKTADVWISVNEHGAKLRKADYVVAMDNTHTGLKVPMDKHIRQYTDAPIIGPWHFNDYQITKWPAQPKMWLSGVVAMWVAHLMGAHPIILAGYDCHNGSAETMRQHKDFAQYLGDDVRVVSGPLQGLYKPYDASERRAKYKAPEVFNDALDGQIKVRVVKPGITVRGYEWPVGTELTVAWHEVRRQLKHKSLLEIESR